MNLIWLANALLALTHAVLAGGVYNTSIWLVATLVAFLNWYTDYEDTSTNTIGVAVFIWNAWWLYVRLFGVSGA